MPNRAPTHKPIAPRVREQLQQRADESKNVKRSRLYGTQRWRRYSLQRLKEHPWCEECAARGIVERAVVTDHVKPHNDDEALFWDPSNHQSLCKTDHDAKTAREDGGFGNRIRGPRTASQAPPGVPRG